MSIKQQRKLLFSMLYLVNIRRKTFRCEWAVSILGTHPKKAAPAPGPTGEWRRWL